MLKQFRQRKSHVSATHEELCCLVYEIAWDIYFRCYTVHVVELLNYYTNYCTYIKFMKFTH